MIIIYYSMIIINWLMMVNNVTAPFYAVIFDNYHMFHEFWIINLV